MGEPGNQQYEYSPITDARGIRQLELYPSSDKGAPICGSLLHTILPTNDDIFDDYTALSYVWGDNNKTSIVLIDGRPLVVTKNLDCALKHMRSEKKKIYIWADAICINQNDDIEKAQQVQQMGNVYKAARYTVIFLGPCLDEPDEALAAALENFSEKKSDETANTHLKALKKLLQHPWFSRTWIFQELALSRDPRVRFGYRTCQWTSFCEFRDTWDSPLSLQTPIADENLHKIQKAITGYKNRNSSVDVAPSQAAFTQLLELLQIRRGLGVSDPRDIIFAHIGLFEGTGIQANYTLTEAEVFHNLTKKHIELFKDLSILNHLDSIPMSDKRNSIASWAIDWTLLTKTPPCRIAANHNLSYTDPIRRNGSKSRNDTFHFLQNPDLLCVGGYILKSCTSELQDIIDTDFMKTVPKPPRPTHTHGKQRYPEWKQEVKQFWDKSSGGGTYQFKYTGFGKDPGKRIRDFLLEDPKKQTELIGRRLARMGNRLALLPGNAEAGDKVCMLSGACTPLLIRDVHPEILDITRLNSRIWRAVEASYPKGMSGIRHVQIIGECVVDGYMNGQTSKDIWLFAIH